MVWPIVHASTTAISSSSASSSPGLRSRAAAPAPNLRMEVGWTYEMPGRPALLTGGRVIGRHLERRGGAAISRRVTGGDGRGRGGS
jgi:hypothetical protein